MAELDIIKAGIEGAKLGFLGGFGLYFLSSKPIFHSLVLLSASCLCLWTASLPFNKLYRFYVIFIWVPGCVGFLLTSSMCISVCKFVSMIARIII